MIGQLDRDTLARLLRQNGLNKSRVAHELGITPERVDQLCKDRGVKITITRDLEFVEPENKRLREEWLAQKGDGHAE